MLAIRGGALVLQEAELAPVRMGGRHSVVAREDSMVEFIAMIQASTHELFLPSCLDSAGCSHRVHCMRS